MQRGSRNYQNFCKVFPMPKPPMSPSQTPHFSSSTGPNHIETNKSCSPFSLFSSVPVEEIAFPRVDQRSTAMRLRTSVQIVVGLIAGLNWGVTLLGYLVLEAMHRNIAVSVPTVNGCKGAVVSISVLQILLIVYYWKCKLAYSEVLRAVVQPQAIPLPSLLYSPQPLSVCIAECVIHLLVFLPYANYSWDFEIFSTGDGFSWDELSYVAILIRNYHSLRVLYWTSTFSSLHTATVTYIVRASYRLSFILRCFLVEYGLPLVLASYGVVVLIPGIFEYMFEHEVNTNQLDVIWNDFWVVFYTQTTIGYGEDPPQTFFGQVMILISALVGYFNLGLINSVSRSRAALSLREWTFYSEIRYRREKKKYLLEATVLIQRWWRLVTMRRQKKLQANLIFPYFKQLHVYKNILASCTRVKDTRFERKITAFDRSVRPPLRSLQKYLSPIETDRFLVAEVFQNAKAVKIKCSRICKLTEKYAQCTISQASRASSSLSSSIPLDVLNRVEVRKSSQRRAKAAFQKMLSRLVGKTRT